MTEVLISHLLLAGDSEEPMKCPVLAVDETDVKGEGKEEGAEVPASRKEDGDETDVKGEGKEEVPASRKEDGDETDVKGEGKEEVPASREEDGGSRDSKLLSAPPDTSEC